MIDFFQQECHGHSRKRRFGLCDKTLPSIEPAYIDEANGGTWIATVVNEHEEIINFYAIDHCVTLTPRLDGKESKRCDGVLVLNDIIAFVELKSREHRSPEWVKDAHEQLRDTILKYINEGNPDTFIKKRGYICNDMKPQARRGQAERIERFADETKGYILYVQATINLHSISG